MLLEETEGKFNKYMDNLANLEHVDNIDNSIISLSVSLQTTNKKINTLTNTPDVEINKKSLDFGIVFPGEIANTKIKLKNSSITDKSVVDLLLSSQGKCFSLSENEILTEKKFLLKENEELEFDITLITPFRKKSERLSATLQIFTDQNLLCNLPINANVEIPKLLCLKEMSSPHAKFPLINLMLEVKTKGQKFRIPFKNSSNKDIEVEFSIDKNNTLSHSVFIFEENYYECQFLFFPNFLVVPSQGSNYIDIVAKIKRAKLDENIEESKITNKVRKIIAAKIKNSTIFYTFFTEAVFKNSA